jgi:hypothetical protein
MTSVRPAALRSASAAVALVALVAAVPALASAAGCEGTLSGAVAGRFRCVAEIVAGDDGRLVFVVTPAAPIAGVPGYVPGAFELAGAASPGTYTLDGLGVGKASVAAEGGTLYTAAKTTGQRGEVTLTLTSVKRRKSGGYAVHGRYRARLVPASSARTDDVVVEVRF